MALYILISILILLVCLLLGLVVLVQDSKGGGLASNFSSSNQYMGVRKTADFLEKSTWTLAALFLIFSLASVFILPKNNNEGGLQNELQKISIKANEVPANAFDAQPTQPESAPATEETTPPDEEIEQ